MHERQIREGFLRTPAIYVHCVSVATASGVIGDVKLIDCVLTIVIVIAISIITSTSNSRRH